MNRLTTDAPKPLSVRELLTGDDYFIPMYQRNYAWGGGEIRQLIRDVIDYSSQGRTYHVGSLVVHETEREGRKLYETIDGQQRLTTLTLLACYLKNQPGEDMGWYDRLRIGFESREHSTQTLDAIFRGNLETDEAESLRGATINGGILTGYRIIQQCLDTELKSGCAERAGFVDFLLNHVCIMRVTVPWDTDLNHYFEIMNNRGEQLEKHEVLKSQLMEKLDQNVPEEEREANRRCIHAVWEACSDMERYVQMGFTVPQRDAVFGAGDWGSFLPDGFDSLRSKLGFDSVDPSTVSEELSLDEIIAKTAAGEQSDTEKEGTPERFNTVINFQNFLLHVLRVTTGKEIPLDDKRLLLEFKTHVLEAENPALAIKRFIHGLLRCKHLLDHYVLKREFLGGKNHWSLKRCKWVSTVRGQGSASYVNSFSKEGDEEADDGINRQILMLLSAFHVSTPTMAYKYWLNAALNHLYQQPQQGIQSAAYLDYLQSVARSFVFDGYLKGAGYFEMIHERKGICQTDLAAVSDDDLSKVLRFPEVENIVFNYLDYLLWLELSPKNAAIKNWEFTFRSSVEHFYPQTPMEGWPGLGDELLHSFGNLCLISHSKNSRLSNFTPKAKQELYPPGTFDSIKQRLMLDQEWSAEAILEHQKEMFDRLLQRKPTTDEAAP